jgi:hypothetical protein
MTGAIPVVARMVNMCFLITAKFIVFLKYHQYDNPAIILPRSTHIAL